MCFPPPNIYQHAWICRYTNVHFFYNLVYFPRLEKCYHVVFDCSCITVKNVRAQCHSFTLTCCLGPPLWSCISRFKTVLPVRQEILSGPLHYLWLQIPVCFPYTSISILYGCSVCQISTLADGGLFLTWFLGWLLSATMPHAAWYLLKS